MSSDKHMMNPSENIKCNSLFPLDMPQEHLLIWGISSIVLSLITIIANSLVIYALYKTKQLDTITHKFVLVMNLSDLCTGIIALPFISSLIFMKRFFRCCTCELAAQCIALFFAYVSFFMIMWVAIDRYIHVTKLNRYNAFMNNFRMKIIVIISVVTSAVAAYLTIAVPSFLMQLLLNISDLLGVFIMIVFYSLVFQKLRLHAENYKKMLGNMAARKADKEVKREISATKTVRLLLLSILILYLPYNIFTAVWTYEKFNLGREPSLPLNITLYWSYLFVFSNTAVNAIIFGYGNTTLRRYIVNKFRKSENRVSAMTSFAGD